MLGQPGVGQHVGQLAEGRGHVPHHTHGAAAAIVSVLASTGHPMMLQLLVSVLASTRHPMKTWDMHYQIRLSHEDSNLSAII